MHGAKSTPTEVRPHTAATSTPDPATAPMMPRRIRLRQEDFIDYGYTVGCPGCESIQLESNVQMGHNEDGRARMEEELSKTDRGKEIMGRAKDRIDEESCTGHGETAPEVKDFSMVQRSPGRMPATLLTMAGGPKTWREGSSSELWPRS